MGQGNRTSLRVVGNVPDADEILESVKPRGGGTRLEKWLSDDADRETLFWAVMELGRDRGMPFAPTLEAFMGHFPDAPRLGVQSAKRVVDARLADR